MEGHCSTGQSLQSAVVPMEEEEVYKINDRCEGEYILKTAYE